MFLRKYETVTLVNPEHGEEGIEKVVGRMKEALEKTGGREIRLEDWGRRKTAFRLQRSGATKATYLYYLYLGEKTTVRELERLLKITEQAMVWQTVALEDRIDPETFDFEAEAAQQTMQFERKEEILRTEAEAETRAKAVRAQIEQEAIGRGRPQRQDEDEGARGSEEGAEAGAEAEGDSKADASAETPAPSEEA